MNIRSWLGLFNRLWIPGATVRVGVWIVGPDGKRDLDVGVRGMLEGPPHFMHLGCKDWSEPEGVWSRHKAQIARPAI
jgi:hypothetical protein